MKKKVLMMMAASHFLIKEWVDAPYLSAGTSIVASGIDTEKYDVDFFDYDSYLVKRYISCMKYFGDKSILEASDNKLLRLFEPFHNVDKYDYIVMSIYYYGSIWERFWEFNIKFMDYLREKNPNTIIVGGGQLHYYRNTKSKELCDQLMSKFDVFLDDRRVIPQNIPDIMENLSIESVEWDIRKLNTLCPEPYNKEDLECTYEEIFRASHIPLPKGVPKNKAIRQCEMVFNEGCVGKCIFCYSGRIPFKSLPFDKLEAILKTRYFEQGYNSFKFLNNITNPSIKYLEKFCNLIVRNNMKFCWSDSMRFQDMGPDEYKMVFESGGRVIYYGCESVDNDMLKLINKEITADDILNGLRWSHEAGIWNAANFIIGFPRENADAVSNLIKFFRENADYIDTVYLNYFRLVGKSHFYFNCDEWGLTLAEGKDNYNSRFLGFMYDEVDGLGWDMIRRVKRFKRELVLKDLRRTNNHLLYRTSQHLIIALYDIFNDDKKKVRGYYK